MLEFEEQKLRLSGYKPELLDLADALGLKELQVEVERLEEQSAQPDFWDDVPLYYPQQHAGTARRGLGAVRGGAACRGS